MGTVADSIFLGSKITADSDCSHEIKTPAHWEESYDKPRQHIKKQRHHFATGSLVIMYRCESWTINNTECRRIDAFKLGCWRRLLRVLWIVRRSNQSILKESKPEYPLEGLMLKLQCFGHLMQKADSLEKNLMLRKIEGRRRRGKQRMGWLDSIINSMDMSLGKFWELVIDRGTLHAAVHGVAKSQIRLSDRTELSVSSFWPRSLRDSLWLPTLEPQEVVRG